MTQDADHDPEFEAFLRRRSPMHRRLSQIDHAEPSAEVDRIVLDRARDAIGTPAQEPIYRTSRWAMPLGLAATILIAFTVVLNIDHRRAGAPGQQSLNASARLADAPAAAPMSQLIERARQDAAGEDAADASVAEEAESSPASPPPALARDSGATERRQSEEPKRVAKSEAAPAAAAGAGPAAEQPEVIARAFAEKRAEAERDDAASTKDTESDNPAEIVSRRDRTVASGRSGGILVMPESIGAATASANAAPPPASAPVADVRASPETWLQEISRLRAEGKNEEADREMAAFRRAHPAHPGYSLAQPPTR